MHRIILFIMLIITFPIKTGDQNPLGKKNSSSKFAQHRPQEKSSGYHEKQTPFLIKKALDGLEEQKCNLEKEKENIKMLLEQESDSQMKGRHQARLARINDDLQTISTREEELKGGHE